jgi:hypothetical protein
VLTAAGLLGAMACQDILKVEDPQSFVSDKLDNPIMLPAVAAGAEGDFQLSLANLSFWTGMLSDEMMNTSTWSGWKDISDGNIRQNGASDAYFGDTQDRLLRARFAAQDAAVRFTRVMGDTAATSPLMVQVKVTDGWIDLVLAGAYCETPASQGSAAVSDVEMYKQAIQKLTDALPLAQNAHYDKPEDKQAWVDYVHAGLARANLMVGDYDAALANAQAVSAGFEKDAIYSDNSGRQNNDLAQQGTLSYNRSGSLRDIWYPMVDTVAGYMRDPYTGELDKRLPFKQDNNNANEKRLGADGVTRYMGLSKFPSLSSPIAITKKAEMNLIEAEVAWRKADNATAVADMNLNRAAVGLSPLPEANPDSATTFEYLLHERFATMYGEGQRLQDVYRFGLMKQLLGSGRALKLPMSRSEMLYNTNIGEGNGTCPGVS